MENTLKKSYVEVGKILDILGDTYKQKLPENVKRLFDVHENYACNVKIDEDTNVEEIQISRKALIIISILNLKYWEEDSDKKEKLKEQYYSNEVKFQEKINLYKRDDWIKNRTNIPKTRIKENNTETSLIISKDNSVIAKIKRFFINLIYNRK